MTITESARTLGFVRPGVSSCVFVIACCSFQLGHRKRSEPRFFNRSQGKSLFQSELFVDRALIRSKAFFNSVGQECPTYFEKVVCPAIGRLNRGWDWRCQSLLLQARQRSCRHRFGLRYRSKLARELCPQPVPSLLR